MLEENGASSRGRAPPAGGQASRCRRSGRLRRRPTMIDVANEARVSQTTVSLVLNHADGARLSAETRQRVMKAAARLGYQPVRRRGARRASSPTSIGFVCDEISTDPWTAIGLDGVREKAWEQGLTVTVMVTRGDADMEAAALAELASRRSSGSSTRPSTRASSILPPPLMHWPVGAPQLPRGERA